MNHKHRAGEPALRSEGLWGMGGGTKRGVSAEKSVDAERGERRGILSVTLMAQPFVTYRHSRSNRRIKKCNIFCTVRDKKIAVNLADNTFYHFLH